MFNVEGFHRGSILEMGVSQSTNGFPQVVMRLQAEEMYDEESKGWFPWADIDFTDEERIANEITVYQVLFGAKGATLSCDYVKKITGWDGDSFSTLQDMDISGMKIQFKVSPNNYRNDGSLEVSWIDEYDAAPSTGVRKADAETLKDLDAKFAEFLAKTNKPASAKAGKKAAPKTTPKRTAKKKKEEPAPAPAETATAPPAPAKTKTAPPAAPVKTEPEAPLFDKTGPCTMNEAWADVNELNDKTDADALAEIWTAAIETVAPDKEYEDLTGEDWSAVRASVLDLVAKF